MKIKAEDLKKELLNVVSGERVWYKDNYKICYGGMDKILNDIVKAVNNMIKEIK